MMDSAILLNLTSKLMFEDTDPLMSVIGGDGPLLFYDRLSVEKFPSEAALCQQHMEKLVSCMYNLLETRSLSVDDHGERIRLIVTLDLIGGAFLPEDANKKCFPAQKARQFKNLVECIVGKGNPLLNRFDYYFLFLYSSSEDQTKAEFYTMLAYDGHSGMYADEWVGCVKLNDCRDEVIAKMNQPKDEWLLTREENAHCYQIFEKEFRNIVRTITDRMKEAGMGNEFEALFRQKTEGIKTVENFRQFDYDGTLYQCISELIGFCSCDFQNDSTFFIIATDVSNARNRCVSAAFVTSLVQFLVTLGSKENNQNQIQLLHCRNTARVFSIRVPCSNASGVFNSSAFASLERQYGECKQKLETARWKKNMKVTWKVYTPNAKESKRTDAYDNIKDKLSEDRQALKDTFTRIRKVPFFFGSRVGDWDWYKKVVEAAEALFRFETIHDRPLYDMPQRITDSEMTSKDAEGDNDYGKLEYQISILKKQTDTKEGSKKIIDLNTYLKDRQKLMDDYEAAIDKLKKAMVKLGYCTCLFWLGVFSMFAFTLCYAYHFFSFAGKDTPWLIVACFVVSVLSFVLAAIVGQANLKSKIKAAHYEMDGIYDKMQRNLKDYLEGVGELVKQQDDADVRRKNLDEMESKLAQFEAHNKQVDLWDGHYQRVIQKLTAIREFLFGNQDVEEGSSNGIKIDAADFDFDKAFPSLPSVVRRLYENQTVQFSQQRINLEGVTSFVKSFEFAENNI